MKKVLCEFYNYNKKTFDQVEIDFDLKVYPCCSYYKQYRCGTEIKKDDPFLKLNTSLKNKSLREIISLFDGIFNEETWGNPDQCPSLCKKCIIVERNKKNVIIK